MDWVRHAGREIRYGFAVVIGAHGGAGLAMTGEGGGERVADALPAGGGETVDGQ